MKRCSEPHGCLGKDIPGRAKSKCKGPEVREGLECWGNGNGTTGWRERGQEVRTEKEWGKIVPGLVSHAEDLAFMLSELGAAAGGL